MPENQARRIHDQLVSALVRLRRAEQSAVTLFARVMEAGLHRELGHATIELYGMQGLGLSRAKTRQFIRLARALDHLPATRDALDTGRLAWTKARTLVAVATPRTESRWLAAAATSTSRELETKVCKARARNCRERDRLRRHRGQATLVLDEDEPAPSPPVELPVSVTLSLSPIQHARLTGLLEGLRKQRRPGTREDLLLAGLESLAAEREPRGSSAAPYHVVAYRCEVCNTTSVQGRPVAQAAAAAVLCDSVQVSPDRTRPNRASIPPAVRRAVLARDGHVCTTGGCGAAHFLEVHHVVPRTQGGSNRPENLRTLCSACHRFAHARGRT